MRRPKNRRKFRRITIDATLANVYCLTEQGQPSGEEWPSLASEDISPEGVFLRTTRELPQGTVVTLHVRLPSMSQPLSCRARVVRIERAVGGVVRGLGCQFVDLNDHQRVQLLEHIYRSYHAHRRF